MHAAAPFQFIDEVKVFFYDDDRCVKVTDTLKAVINFLANIDSNILFGGRRCGKSTHHLGDSNVTSDKITENRVDVSISLCPPKFHL
jgi:hypothetical protein